MHIKVQHRRAANGMALAAAASLQKAQAGGLKEEMVRAHIRLKSSAHLSIR